MIFKNSESAIQYGRGNPEKLHMLIACEEKFRALSAEKLKRKEFQMSMNLAFKAQLCREAREMII